MTAEEIEGLLLNATPGPWPCKPTGDYKRILIGDGLVDGPNGYEVAEVYSDDCDRNEAEANAALISAVHPLARTALAALAEVERLEAVQERLCVALREIARETYTDNIGDRWPTRGATIARAAIGDKGAGG